MSIFSGSITGSFVSTGEDVFISLKSGVNRFDLYNETVLAAAGDGDLAQITWRPGQATGTCIGYLKEATIDALTPGLITSAIYLKDTNTPQLGASTVLTAISTAAIPVVSTANTAGLTPNSSIIRIYQTTNAGQLSTVDFTVGTVTANTNFQLKYMSALPTAGTAGSFRIVEPSYYYPPRRTIASMSVNAIDASLTDIIFTVQHNYVVGQIIRLSVPHVTNAAFGVDYLNGKEVTILATNAVTNSVTVDVTLTGTFAWPLYTDPGAFTPPFVNPVGEKTSVALAAGLDPVNGKYINNNDYGILLKAGAGLPAGVDGDVISWIAYKSLNE